MSKKAEKEAQRLEAITALKKMVTPGMRIYTQLEHVGSSGMSRRIKVFIPVTSDYEQNKMSIRDITYWTAHACGYRFNGDKGSIVIGGCGMDMGYAIVYSLSRVLFADDFKCIGEHCPSNDHVNDRDGSFKREAANIGRKHSDGGYALTHSWL